LSLKGACLDTIPSSWDKKERRLNADRRSSGRGGKYDRRRNRCVHCVHFKTPDSGVIGFCKFHERPVLQEAFACPEFRSPD
jgi:hypothetical protein